MLQEDRQQQYMEWNAERDVDEEKEKPNQIFSNI
jgi:hypothetical protein